VFGSSLVVFSVQALLTVDIVLLVVGPLTVILLALPARLLRHPQYEWPTATSAWTALTVTPAQWWAMASPQQLWAAASSREWAWERLRHGIIKARFWIALLLVILTETLLILGYLEINPFVSPLSAYLPSPSALLDINTLCR
jgi:hypothetical protein